MTFVAALTIFVASLAADQSSLPRLPDTGSRADPVLDEATRKLDPRADGWDSEVFATETGVQLEILGEMLHLHPVLVLGILVVGEHFFHVWGLLLGVPIMVYIIHYVILEESALRKAGVVPATAVSSGPES